MFIKGKLGERTRRLAASSCKAGGCEAIIFVNKGCYTLDSIVVRMYVHVNWGEQFLSRLHVAEPIRFLGQH